MVHRTYRRYLALGVLLPLLGSVVGGCTGKPFEAADHLMSASAMDDPQDTDTDGEQSPTAATAPSGLNADDVSSSEWAEPEAAQAEPSDDSQEQDDSSGPNLGGSPGDDGAGGSMEVLEPSPSEPDVSSPDSSGSGGASGGATNAGSDGPDDETGEEEIAGGASNSTGDGGVEKPDLSIDSGMETPLPPPCEDNEERGPGRHCYFFGHQPAEWDVARERCRNRGDGWDLVAVNSEEEHAWIVERLEDETWLGGVNVRNRWVWVNTETVFWEGEENGSAVNGSYTHWESAEPNGGNGSGQCARYSHDSGEWAWTDLICTREHLFICELTPATLRCEESCSHGN
jgi:hypothetical protein